MFPNWLRFVFIVFLKNIKIVIIKITNLWIIWSDEDQAWNVRWQALGWHDVSAEGKKSQGPLRNHLCFELCAVLPVIQKSPHHFCYSLSVFLIFFIIQCACGAVIHIPWLWNFCASYWALSSAKIKLKLESCFRPVSKEMAFYDQFFCSVYLIVLSPERSV